MCLNFPQQHMVNNKLIIIHKSLLLLQFSFVNLYLYNNKIIYNKVIILLKLFIYFNHSLSI